MDRLSIAIRAYAEKPNTGRARRAAAAALAEPSPWTVVFDTETTTDPAQSLRLGAYQVRHGDALFEAGLFCPAEGLSAAERATLAAFASERVKVRELADFIEGVLLRFGYELGGQIVGFNLPFDISRLAMDHGEARGSLRGGFSFKLSARTDRPRLRVKHLSRHAALIDFAMPGKQDTPRGMRGRGLKAAAHRGYFVDVATLARALTARGFTLAGLCAFLETETRKQETSDHGAALTADYLAYAQMDVQATWECFRALRDRLAQHGLSKPPHRILSEASLGKAYLEAMGVRPLLQVAPDTDRAIFGKAMGAYYGGRAEVRWRRTPKRVHYVDFKSMYPTVNTLMGCWAFVTAEGFTTHDGTEAVRTFLGELTTEAMFSPAAWRSLIGLARVRPDGDLLPVRAQYDGRVYTIGLNYLSADRSLWYTIADLAAATLLSGKTPVVEEAILFEPGLPQTDIRPIVLFGDTRFRVDPARDDVFKRLIDLRDQAKRDGDPVEKAIKIVANATSYGIFVEVNRDDAPKPEPLSFIDPWGETHGIKSTALEDPGRYFNPIVAVLITGAARLMLALAERAVLDEGLDWVFCDTDSLAIAKPDHMDETDFAARCARVIGRFEHLNPFEKAGSILQVESVNFDLDTKRPTPLYAYAISAKRYALFNMGRDGAPILRKASAHGLGHLRSPYDDSAAPQHLPAPQRPSAELGVSRWQHDLWLRIVAAALAGAPDRVDLSALPNMDAPAVSRYGATSPGLLAWFKLWNAGKPYRDQVKPFGFMLAFQGRNGLWAEAQPLDLDALPGRGRPKRVTPKLSPVGPFERDPVAASAAAFDRETGAPLRSDKLMTYAEALAQYHLSPESKFLGGEFMDRGRTERRHVLAAAIRLIGKESNRVDEVAPVGLDGRSIAAYSLGS